MDALGGDTSAFEDGANSATCLVIKKNQTILFNVYEGIPDTLLLNVITWLLLILLFYLLRQQAWDYGRLALVNNGREGKTWTQIFFAQEYSETAKTARAQESTGTSFVEKTGALAWIKTTLKLSKEQLLAHSGPDALHYLSFQEHLIFVMFVITTISLTVILPVNLQGTLYANASTFGHTTIANLDPDSSWLWVHTFVAIMYAPLIVLVMRRSSGRYAGKTAPTRTLMVMNISKADCQPAIIREYINERYPDIMIEDVQVAYKIDRLTDAAEEYNKVVLARQFCERHRGREEIKVTVNFFKCQQRDALQYYRDKEIQLFAQVARLKSIAVNEPLGIAFITLSTADAAQMILKHFRPGTRYNWALSFAPNPTDLFWENLSDNSAGWYIRWAIVNIVLFVFLFTFTTPTLILQTLNTMSVYQDFTNLTPLMSEFLPTLLLWTVSILLPVIVGFSEKWLQHWTKSRLNYAIMTKSFGYLLLMILILPSMGLTSAQGFLEWTIHKANRNESFRWQCIFLPDKGAFFVNYVITAAFIGTAAELLRFSELFYYAWQIVTARSRAEIPYIRKTILTEFPFGYHYAWQLIIFTVSVCYSVATPLIMPFAMVYICLKYLCDRYNLVFAYGPSYMIGQGGGKMHSTAVTLTKFSVVILMVNMAALSYIRSKGDAFSARTFVFGAALCITLGLFAFMSPIKRCTSKPPRLREDFTQMPLYVAPVLQDQARYAERRVDYGSDTASVVMTQGEEEVSSVTSVASA